MRRVQSRVDPPAPDNFALVVCRRQLELKRLPVGIQDHVKYKVLVADLGCECEAVGGVAPVRLPELYTMPDFERLPDELVQREAFEIRLLIHQQPSCIEQGCEPMYISVFHDQRPIKPTGLVVLAIGVVITTLCAPDLVTHQNHRQTQREHGHGQKVLYLPVSYLFYLGVIRWAFNTPVAASVVVGAILVGFAVQLVVLLVVRDKIVEREAVVTCHEVHALIGLAFFVTVDLWAAEQSVGKIDYCSVVPTKKAADIIAEPSVPLPPTVADEAAHLVQASRIPGFSNELGAGEHRVRLDIPQYRRPRH